jgi:hypothetical protein
MYGGGDDVSRVRGRCDDCSEWREHGDYQHDNAGLEEIRLASCYDHGGGGAVGECGECEWECGADSHGDGDGWSGGVGACYIVVRVGI